MAGQVEIHSVEEDEEAVVEIITYNDVTINIESLTKEQLSFIVNNSEGVGGKIITIRFGPGTLQDMKNISVLYDNQSISWVSFDAIFTPTSALMNATWTSVLAIDAEGAEILYLLIWVPHFSEHTISIISFTQLVEAFDIITIAIFYSAISIIVVVFFFSPLLGSIAHRRLYLRKKK